jgi:tetratricopeptide (TPR) repeat protein
MTMRLPGSGRPVAAILALAVFVIASAASAASAPARAAQAQEAKPQSAFPDDPVALVTEANRLKAQGRLDEALATYQRAAKLDSRSFDAHLGIGLVLDLQGNYAEARRELDKAIEAAPENARDQRDQALSSMAVSYAFEGDVDQARLYYEKLYDYQVSTQRLDKAASTANTIGRAYLDAGDTKNAAQWYQTGHETVKKMSGLPSDELDLWQMRWEHAQARIAARSGHPEEADTHTAAVKALVDKGGVNAMLGQNYQYLVGYTAFYAGDLDAAIAALQQADQRDPSILGMLAEAYAKKGDMDAAHAYADKVTAAPLHSLQSAMTRRELKKLDELKPKEKDELKPKEKSEQDDSNQDKKDQDKDKGDKAKAKREP